MDPIMGRSGEVLDERVVTSFGEGLSGDLFRSDHAPYDDARTVWNGLIDHRPSVIVQCVDEGDVAACVRFAREHDIEASIRGGGHNIAGNGVADGGLMIDLSLMKHIDVDPGARTARAQPGLKLGGFDAATQVYGLATTMGIATDTGIAGLTLGGGYGWLAGLHGMSCDNLLSVNIITADGELLEANERQNEDLFWAVRGGGGNFGIVTSFEYRLHEVGPVLGGMTIYPRTADALRFFDEFSREAPDEVSTVGLVLTAPDGTPAFGIVACYSGPLDKGERVLEPLGSFGPPLVDMVEIRPYVEMQQVTDPAWPPGRLYYWKSSLVRQLEDQMIDALLEHAERMPVPFSVIYLQQLHGAAARVDSSRTAFPHRFDHFNCGAMLETEDPAEVESGKRWCTETWDAVQPWVEASNYVNDLGEGEGDRIAGSYGPNLGRLVELKAKYDPTNFFHLNTNIEPAAV